MNWFKKLQSILLVAVMVLSMFSPMATAAPIGGGEYTFKFTDLGSSGIKLYYSVNGRTPLTELPANQSITVTAPDVKAVKFYIKVLDGYDSSTLYVEFVSSNQAGELFDDVNEYTSLGGESFVAANAAAAARGCTKAFHYSIFAQNGEYDERTFRITATRPGETTYSVSYLPGEHGTFRQVTYTRLSYGAATPAAPTVTGEEGWSFIGWSPEVTDTVTGDVRYVAQWTRGYVVRFLDWDGRVISSTAYNRGNRITVPANPTRAADGTYAYTFAGWTPTVPTRCYASADYTATYNRAFINYTVRFLDYDGSVISTKTDYHFGDTVVVPADPTRAATDSNIYTFAGWTPTVVMSVAGDADYTATYNTQANSYTVRFLNWNGSVIDSDEYSFGDTVVVPLTRQGPAAATTPTSLPAGRRRLS